MLPISDLIWAIPNTTLPLSSKIQRISIPCHPLFAQFQRSILLGAVEGGRHLYQAISKLDFAGHATDQANS